MSEHIPPILNEEALTSIVGHWPAFHDAEILSISLDRGADDPEASIPSLTARIHLLEASGEVLTTLRFDGLVLEVLDNFNEQNVLFDIAIKDITEDPLDATTDTFYSDVSTRGLQFKVRFNSSYGCSASFACQSISVISVEPIPSTENG